ncbi:MAG: squalene/phytoene synthase family protein [Pseudomonadota bacterium]
MTVAQCAALVQGGDPDRFLSAMTGDEGARARLFPLYAFNLEIARAPWLTAEETLARIRLQWWREVIEEIFAGAPVRRHEVAEALAEVVRAADLPRALLDRMIDAREEEIGGQHPRPLSPFIEGTAGALMRLSAQAAHGAPDAGLDAMASDLGRAHGIASYLAAQPALMERGLPALPPDEIAALAATGLDSLERAKTSRRTVPRAALPALRAAWRAPVRLRRAAARPNEVLQGVLETSEVRRRASLLWRTLTGAI